MQSLERFAGALAGTLLVSSLALAAPPGQKVLTHEEQEALARRFAPTFLYHANESYFPCSPFFTLTPNEDRLAVRESLGTPAHRARLYLALELAQKLVRARVFFQAYPLRGGSARRVVVEYWLYYARDEYVARGGLVPLAFDTSHPNDMEHLFVVLKLNREEWAIERILASAHSDKVPDNIYVYPEDRPARRTPPILVELGSHAMAPDVNADGRFTLGVDSGRGGKFRWGIRDEGKTWARYASSYMKPREPSAPAENVARAPRRSGSGGLDEWGDFGSELPRTAVTSSVALTDYALEHVSSLALDYARLALSKEEAQVIFQEGVPWFTRLFGRSNGESHKLLLPNLHEDFGRPDRMAGGYGRNDCGVALGYTVILAHHTFFAAARKRFINDSRYLPDLVLEGHAFLTNRNTDFYEASALGYYPLDASTKLFAGAALLTDSVRFQKRELDWMAGIEFDLGPFKLRNAVRATGSVSNARWDFRVYVFPW